MDERFIQNNRIDIFIIIASKIKTILKKNKTFSSIF